MKIGILTLPLHVNYGGILQAYALQKILLDLGHTPFLIERKRKKHNPSFLVLLKRIIKKFVLRRRVELLYEKRYNYEMPIMCQNTWTFVDKHIKIYRYSNSLNEIKEGLFDGIIVGSDQIWRKLYFESLVEKNIMNAFLYFCSSWSIKRISYAASFGTNIWEYNKKETKKISDLLNNFDLVTVRETDGVSMLKKNLDINATMVLDPTLLLDKNDYLKLIDGAEVSKREGGLLCYILDNNKEKEELVEKLSNKLHVHPFFANSKAEDGEAPLIERIQPPVEQWLSDFYNASYVITDSFHACVFSIIFNKPFWVIGNKERGLSRIDNLLKQLLLENRIINNNSFTYTMIDWESVNNKMENLKKYSIKILCNSLNLEK